MSYPEFPEDRVVREERVVRDEPVRRRIVTERRTVGGPGFGMNPVGAILAGVLVIFILVLIFGYLL